MPTRPMSEMRMLSPVQMTVSDKRRYQGCSSPPTLLVLEQCRERREVVRALRVKLGPELVAAVRDRRIRELIIRQNGIISAPLTSGTTTNPCRASYDVRYIGGSRAQLVQHSHPLHHEHPDGGEDWRLLKHLRIIRGGRALLRGKLEIAAQVRHVVLVALDRVHRFLYGAQRRVSSSSPFGRSQARLEARSERNDTHVVGVVADFPREEGREYELFVMAMSTDDAAPGAWVAAQGREGSARTVSSKKPRILLAHFELYMVPWPSCERTPRLLAPFCACARPGVLTSCAAAPDACRRGKVRLISSAVRHALQREAGQPHRCRRRK